jgi:hypothetical protein
MEQPHIGELGCQIGHHRGSDCAKGQPPHFKESGVGWGISDARQYTPQPQDQHNPAVQQQADPDQLRGLVLTPDLADQVGAQKGQWVGQGADRHHDWPGTDAAQLQKAGQTQDVEHRHRA